MFFLGEYIIPHYARVKESSIRDEGTYLGHLLAFPRIRLKRLRREIYEQIGLCYQIGGVAFVAGLVLFVVSHLF